MHVVVCLVNGVLVVYMMCVLYMYELQMCFVRICIVYLYTYVCVRSACIDNILFFRCLLAVYMCVYCSTAQKWVSVVIQSSCTLWCITF